MRETVDLEAEEAKALITNLFYTDETVYKILLPLVNEVYIEIEKNKKIRGSEISNLEFYIKGTIGLVLALFKSGHITSLKNKHFPLTDIDAVLLFNVDTPNRNHYENIMKSIFQRICYKYRYFFERNKKLINRFYQIEKEFKPTGNFKSIRKIKLFDSLKYKKKGFQSPWKRDFDDNKHHVKLRINENIEGKDFFLYRLWAPYSVMLNDGRIKKINVELVDISLQKVSNIKKIPSLQIFRDIEKLRRSFFTSPRDADDVPVLRTVEAIRNIYPQKTEEGHIYDLHLEMWHRIRDLEKNYITTLLYNGIILPITSLKYQLIENMMILLNDPNDPKTTKRIKKIRILLSYLFPNKSFKESKLEI